MKRVSFVLAAAAFLSLAACSGPEVLEGNSRSVMIQQSDSDDVKGALKAADHHCAQYDRAAQYKGRVTSEQLAYDCVQ
jgi:hypothetical protein